MPDVGPPAEIISPNAEKVEIGRYLAICYGIMVAIAPATGVNSGPSAGTTGRGGELFDRPWDSPQLLFAQYYSTDEDWTWRDLQSHDHGVRKMENRFSCYAHPYYAKWREQILRSHAYLRILTQLLCCKESEADFQWIYINTIRPKQLSTRPLTIGEYGRSSYRRRMYGITRHSKRKPSRDSAFSGRGHSWCPRACYLRNLTAW